MYIRKLAAFLVFLSVTYSVNVSSSDAWETFSDIGAYGLVSTSLAVPMYKSDWDGFKQAGYSVATTTGIVLIGKSQIDEERPDSSGDDSFPSNHVASAFAAATTLNLRYGWRVGLPAYGMASLVGVARVQADKHYWKDVFAGAVIGSLTAWIFTDRFEENVHVVPWASENEAGLTLSVHW